ncbi:MAG TPA: S26 family signal peptidase [Thermoplasmata archaeon]|nr:S26 family signal peptidase [Thermoplasmata archaeon]
MSRADDPELDDADEPEEDRRRRRRAARHPPPRRTRSARPVQRWRGGDDAEDDGEDELEAPRTRRRWFFREKTPVYWRARDSLYFEPLVAVAIIVILLVGLYAYTQNWPPIYVVESQSMQHGSTDILGVINTGDLVLAQRVPTSAITPYVTGMRTGYSTYGEYGDVLLYYPNGVGPTPIIHRAILFLQWNPANGGSYNATDLSGLPCGTAAGAFYNSSSPYGACYVHDLTGPLTLYHVGWSDVTVSLDLSPTLLGAHSGFVTMGDYNFNRPCTPGVNCVGESDQGSGLSALVEPGWIVGVARGMLPWFGAFKLLLEGNAAEVPSQSWQFLGLTIVGLILLAFGIHYALRAEGIEDPRRRRQEEEEVERDEPEDETPPSRTRRFLRGLRAWRRPEEDEEDAVDPKPPRDTAARRSPSRGRPAPRVRRARAKRSADDSDEDL